MATEDSAANARRRLPAIVVILIPVVIAMDVYVFQAFRTVTPSNLLGFVQFFYFSVTVVKVAGLLAYGLRLIEDPTLIRRLKVYFQILLVTSVLMALLLLLEDIVRLILALSNLIADTDMDLSRYLVWDALVMLMGLIFAGVLFAGLRNVYRYKVYRREVPIVGLPEAFEGFTIVQLSDMHLGSLKQPERVAEGVRIANDLQPDLIVFTGDLVNNAASEVTPGLQAVLQQLDAREGVYSILGNHDYGDYVYWPTEDHKRDNLHRLVQTHLDLGWRVLNDAHVFITRGEARMALLGVQNVSGSRRFNTYGSLAKAHAGTGAADVKVLLSHDPSHWRAEVLPHYPDIDLTLSGHTHAGQVGLEWGHIRWGVSKYVYPEWIDLYREGRQWLYVNRGFGVIGYPGRVGFMPEITLLTLRVGYVS